MADIENKQLTDPQETGDIVERLGTPEAIERARLQRERQQRARKLMDQRLQLLRRRGGGGLNDASPDDQAPQIGQQQLLG